MTQDLRWKFLREQDGKIVSQHGRAVWTVGKRKTVQGEIGCCRRGFHSSPGIFAALGYVKGEVLAQVRVAGDSETEGDKSAHRSMVIMKAWRWTQADSVKLAVFAAKQVLDVFEQKRPGDDRPRKAIEAAKAWLADPSGETASAAYAAADAASAAYAAADAASASDAAYAAAYAAYAASASASAYAAAYAAYAASASAARRGLTDRIEAWLQAHIAELEEIQP